MNIHIQQQQPHTAEKSKQATKEEKLEKWGKKKVTLAKKMVLLVYFFYEKCMNSVFFLENIKMWTQKKQQPNKFLCAKSEEFFIVAFFVAVI